METNKPNMNQTGELLKSLRQLMKNLPKNRGSIQAYVVPSDDAHQSEYIAARDERRRFISKFDGSAGTAVVTDTGAYLWTDGRYYQQAAKQLDENWTLMKDGLPTTPTIDVWLARNMQAGTKVGVDPNLYSTRAFTQLKNTGCCIEPIAENLIDLVWPDQPAAPSNAVIPLDVKYAGRTIASKVSEIREQMRDKGTEVLVVSALDEVAYLMNLRGSDIEFNPVFFSYALVTTTSVYLFIDPTKVTPEIQQHFVKNEVEVDVRPYGQVHAVLKELAQAADTKKVWISLNSSYALTALIPEGKRHQEITPICTMKAIKNEVEVQGFINCHVRDGVALCQYFAWLEDAVQRGVYVDELTGADKLEAFRATKEKFMGLSFTTINGFGPNGSVIHYHPKEETNRQITDKELYLCDSGAQYLDGTTDVTRTWHFGTPTAFEKECFTRVLKGQMALGTAIFPRKVKGQFLDTIARKFLWDVGLDYGHGTGHGIGHFLNVHEGPMGIGIRLMPDDPGLQENMFVSNEPGYYEDGKFGIRIEDIVQIVPATVGRSFGDRGALTFHTVTMCPIQTKLVDLELMTVKERDGLNAYHARVFKTLSPYLQEDGDHLTLDWLRKETAAI